MNRLEKFEQAQIETLAKTKEIPDFKAGDTLRVGVRIKEGNKERVQYFEGLCIARTNRGTSSSFKVRKISAGEGVERLFPLYAEVVESIEVVKKGVVRRAKLYYIRERSGKSARIREKLDFTKKSKKAVAVPVEKAEEAKPEVVEAPKAEAKAEEAKSE